MLRLLIGLLLMSFISLQSASWQEPLRVSIEFVDLPKKIIRFPAHDLQVGEFGFVVTKLSDYEIVNSEVVIIAVENGVATAKFRAFESMKQRHLPTPRMVARKGDLVYFRQFNNQAFLIAPNDEIYEQIRATNTDINFISSDLLVTFLNGFDPKIANLRKACNVYSVGVIYIVTTNTLNILSCESFEILEKRELDTSGVTKTSTPFFSRVEGIDAGTLGKLFSGSQSKNYFAYYDALVKKEKRKEVRIEKKEVRIDSREIKREIKQEAIKEPKKANQSTENAPTLEEKNYQKAERKLDSKEERRRSRDERKKTKATKKAMEFEEREKEHDERDEKETEERRKALEMDKGNEKVNAKENEREINQESANKPSSENNATPKDTENTSVLKESAAKKEAPKPSSKEEKRRLKEEKKKAKAEQRAKEFEQRAREHQERDEKELEERRKALEMNKK
ncbi:plasminogen-binding protein PgbA [Helicobacter pylori]|uniref:plasminogen-binding protein PgbA n=1 Tax=Helicobacter pylori TaxID=210 RepID=UPI002711F925|nr:plasminogen-binding N-terminal domain-containing protein [Helicobacter pylori]MDO7815132.1 plasminogen-binding N-terminal domain-containing protein [Helicobacter pylori]MDO7819587.1 plasminogen-binding N-terminal domain-containing protein [Helicobacter pylori]MDO7828723.1 plasminogen-binding N-terminal domain-containing protein [Helicobacter pylori]MDO7866517.1 plasminogen-binding N-terminal domain-containing protein [Helicobacter pylori]WQU17981.1 plasminogen-binding N-terminal domain-cont